MKLYYTPGVCSLAAHIAMHEAGLEFTLERINPNTKRTAGDANYLDVNRNGYVPALDIEPGLVPSVSALNHGRPSEHSASV